MHKLTLRIMNEAMKPRFAGSSGDEVAHGLNQMPTERAEKVFERVGGSPGWFMASFPSLRLCFSAVGKRPAWMQQGPAGYAALSGRVS